MLKLIQDLIDSGREGDFWDFKLEAHANNAELLHDILCLANSVCKNDKYLIFGVSDPVSGCDIKGVGHIPGRRKQIDYINFLRDKKFVSERRPEIQLFTLEIEGKTVEVLKIFDTKFKPYYLTEEFSCNKTKEGLGKPKIVRSYHIYSRVLDTNTPIDRSADEYLVEKMWRERLGVDEEPLKKFVQLLKEFDAWERDINNHEWAYHRIHAEYQLKYSDSASDNDQIYRFCFTNSTSLIGQVEFRFHSTVLNQINYVLVDETRITLPDPDKFTVYTGSKEIRVFYYDLSSFKGAYLTHVTFGQLDFVETSANDLFILFNNLEEKEDFEYYLQSNYFELEEIDPPSYLELLKQEIVQSGHSYVYDIEDSIKAALLYKRLIEG